jgi:hypothetical protein
MLSHPSEERSRRCAALSDDGELRKNFFKPFSFETIFVLRSIALRFGHP